MTRKYLYLSFILISAIGLLSVLNSRMIYSYDSAALNRMQAVADLVSMLDSKNIRYEYSIDDIYQKANGHGLASEKLDYYKYNEWGGEIGIIVSMNVAERRGILYLVSPCGGIIQFSKSRECICLPVKVVEINNP